jgi:hypothetical protein
MSGLERVIQNIVLFTPLQPTIDLIILPVKYFLLMQ